MIHIVKRINMLKTNMGDTHGNMDSTFIVIGHRAKTTADFEFNDIAGSGGSLDVLARCIGTTFCLSNGLRKESRAYLVLLGGKDAPKTIKICGNEIQGLNSDERSIAGLMRAALKKEAVKGKWTKSTTGVYISRAGFEDILRELSEEGVTFVHLRESGVDIRGFEFPPHPCFILGDNADLTEEEEGVLNAHPFLKVSVGPISYHASQCITIVHNEMDRRCP